MVPVGEELDSIISGLPPVNLVELNERAALQTRVDTKYLVFPSTLEAVLNDLGDFEVLEIDGKRRFEYDSTYFDTSEWRNFRDHVQGRRRRFKARTRTYVDSDLCMFEIKLEGDDGVTQKKRWKHDLQEAGVLTPKAQSRIDRVLLDRMIYGVYDLQPMLRVIYHRVTLVGKKRPIRVTIDSHLSWSHGDRFASGLDDRLLLEVKTPRIVDPMIRSLAAHGEYPVAMSKYCVGAALLHRELPRAPWDLLMRQHFSRHLLGRVEDASE